ncbi:MULTISPECIES: alpha/beta hydrolase [unclassified Sinorhizobium]|uniref:alpha/beta hydrolase n=1 Tax=unclassified Sinorhizobium TaxID=2613772 RepID=UPI0024C2E957|nr:MULTISPECIES: alpha/beta hydrolase [unclassified Sinorhizobium]MDK1374103.1 alpha/beta hydrolase [Sinorhizobium sp. 6-70]MDK1477843.1 alpha/beta hydrolase [Sinorhizobium sp. 6-117]
MNDTTNMSRLSPEMAALLARVAAETGPQVDPTLMPPAEGRLLSEESNRRWNRELPAMARVTEAWIEPIAELGSEKARVKVLVPDRPLAGAIVFAHGGGFAFCSPETHERCARVLALESGLPVLMPDYRLAPENPYPAGLKDVIATVRQVPLVVNAVGLEAGPLILAGDSAGANLALAAMLHEQAIGLRSAAGALLFYGTYAGDFETASYREFENGPGLTTGKMQRYWYWYVGDRDVSADPLACPLFAKDAALAALPPLHLMAAGVDPLLSDTLALEKRLRGLGRSETATVIPGVTHGFLQNTLDLAAAREALAQAGRAAARMAANT